MKPQFRNSLVRQPGQDGAKLTGALVWQPSPSSRPEQSTGPTVPTVKQAGIDSLCALIDDAVRKIVRAQQAHIAPAPSESIIFLRFSTNQLIRPDRKPIRLERNLPLRMLEALFRRRTMSIARFLLLVRRGEPSGHRGLRQVLSARRHEATMLRRLIEKYDLAIEIQKIDRGTRRIQATFDFDRVQADAVRGQGLARHAIARLTVADYAAALEYASEALRVDYDSSLAAWVVIQVLRTEKMCASKLRCFLNPDVVTRAQVCVGRAIIRYAAATRRLDRSHDPDMQKARRIAVRMLSRLEQYWQVFRAWSFEKSQSGRNESDNRLAQKVFVEAVVDAALGDPSAYVRFANTAIIARVVERLVKNRLEKAGPDRYREIVEALKLQIFTKLILSAWSPQPLSELELQKQVLSEVYRSLDWSTLLSRSSNRMAQLGDHPNIEKCDDSDEE
jgi:hypothetical protein